MKCFAWLVLFVLPFVLTYVGLRLGSAVGEATCAESSDEFLGCLGSVVWGAGIGALAGFLIGLVAVWLLAVRLDRSA